MNTKRKWGTGILLGMALMLAGCAQQAQPARTNEGSVGTSGGGGTLVFSFKTAAIKAINAMEDTDISIGAAPSRAELLRFYTKHKTKWIDALEHLANEPSVVTETNENLIEDGRQVAAHVEPPEAPTHVRLSFPILNVGDGLTEEKAFGLAVHEAGHFVAPNMTRAEHAYLDQIAVMLWNASKTKRAVASRKRLELPAELVHIEDFALSRDGSKLTIIGQETRFGIRIDTLLTIDLSTNRVFRHDYSGLPGMFRMPFAWVLDQDRIVYVSAEKGRPFYNQCAEWNQRTNQIHRFECHNVVKAWLAPDKETVLLYGGEPMPGGKMMGDVIHAVAKGVFQRAYFMPVPHVPVNDWFGNTHFKAWKFTQNGRYAVGRITEGPDVYTGPSISLLDTNDQKRVEMELNPDFKSQPAYLMLGSNLLALNSFRANLFVANLGNLLPSDEPIKLEEKFVESTDTNGGKTLAIRFRKTRCYGFDEASGRLILVRDNDVLTALPTKGLTDEKWIGTYISPHRIWPIAGTSKVVLREATRVEAGQPKSWTTRGYLRLLDLSKDAAGQSTELRVHDEESPKQASHVQAALTPDGVALVSVGQNRLTIEYLEVAP